MCVVDLANKTTTMNPHIAFPDDGSILIEFIHHEFRIGLALDRVPNECSWYIVSKLEEKIFGHGDFHIQELSQFLFRIHEFFDRFTTRGWEEIAQKVLREKHCTWEKLSKM